MRVMREVGVHLRNDLGAAAQRLVKSGDVGGAQPLLAGAVQDRDVVVRRREPVRDLPRPVGRAVIDDQQPARWRQGVERSVDDCLQVRRFVVGRDDEPDPGTHHQRHQPVSGLRPLTSNHQRHQPVSGLRPLTSNHQRHQPVSGLRPLTSNHHRHQPVSGLKPLTSSHDTAWMLFVASGLNRFGAMRNAEIADAMSELATLYELDGAIRYRVLAYREAARVIRQSAVSVAELAQAGRATELPGIGKTLEEKIVTLVETGEIPSAAKLKRKFPVSLVEVTRVPGVGAKTARRLYDELGVSNLDELRAAAEAEKIRGLKGLGPKVE